MPDQDYEVCRACNHPRICHTDFDFAFDTACQVDDCGCIRFEVPEEPGVQEKTTGPLEGYVERSIDRARKLDRGEKIEPEHRVTFQPDDLSTQDFPLGEKITVENPRMSFKLKPPPEGF